MGAVETLIVWENLDVTRHYLRDSSGSEVIVHVHAPPPSATTSKAAEAATGGGINALSEVDRAKFIDKSTGLEMEQSREPQPMLEWLAENYTSMGAQLEVSPLAISRFFFLFFSFEFVLTSSRMACALISLSRTSPRKVHNLSEDSAA